MTYGQFTVKTAGTAVEPTPTPSNPDIPKTGEADHTWVCLLYTSIPRRLYEEICRLRGDIGGRQLFLRHGAEILNYPVTDAREMLDVDTMEDYWKI